MLQCFTRTWGAQYPPPRSSVARSVAGPACTRSMRAGLGSSTAIGSTWTRKSLLRTSRRAGASGPSAIPTGSRATASNTRADAFASSSAETPIARLSTWTRDTGPRSVNFTYPFRRQPAPTLRRLPSPPVGMPPRSRLRQRPSPFPHPARRRRPDRYPLLQGTSARTAADRNAHNVWIAVSAAVGQTRAQRRDQRKSHPRRARSENRATRRGPLRMRASVRAATPITKRARYAAINEAPYPAPLS
jgi:hypothetical protein